jgi:hypothetical protein
MYLKKETEVNIQNIINVLLELTDILKPRRATALIE